MYYSLPRKRHTSMHLDVIRESLSVEDCSKTSPINNNNVDDGLKRHASGTGNSPPTWKFWRFMSMRSSNRKAYKSSLASTLTRDTEINIILPDVVENNPEVKRTSSLKPPPKPPRLYLFRSSSINTPRASVIGETDRNSFTLSEAYQNSTSDDKVIKAKIETPKTPEVQIENVQTDVPRTYVNVFKETHNNVLAPKNSNSLPTKTPKYHDGVIARRHQQTPPTGKIKIVSPDLSRKPVVRPRKKSGEITAEDRHVLILQSAMELICQKLDPFVIIEDLAKEDLITKEDFTAFRGHFDQRALCESVVNSVMDRDYKSFLAFCNVLGSKADYFLVAAVLNAMSAVYDVIYETQATTGDTSPILDDEKSISFDVVYFSQETGKIRSVVELEKSRNTENKRHSRDLLSFKRNSRLSFHSLTSEASSIFSEDLINTGIPMVTVAIAGHIMCSEKAEALSSVLEKHSCILELHIGKTHIKGPDMKYLGRALVQNASIRVLDLRLNSIGNEGAACIANVLAQNRSLKQLILSSTGITTEGCGLIAEALKINATLIDIDLSFLDIGDSGCLALCDMLKQNRCLKKLRLRSANISWIGCGFLLEGIEHGKTVTELDFSRNFIGDDGAEMFQRHMKDDSSLRDLNLENCGITSVGCAILSDVILTNKSLKALDLSVNFIGDQGIVRLSNSLMRNKHIRTLGLNMCGISNDGFSKLLDILEGNPTLSLLKLCYNRLGREYTNPDATSDNLKYRIRIVTSSNPKLKLLLWGNSFDEAHSNIMPATCTQDITATL